MDKRMNIKQENGRPVLQTWVDGSEVIVGFSEEEPKTDVKKGIMRLIMQSYEDRVLRQSEKPAVKNLLDHGNHGTKSIGR